MKPGPFCALLIPMTLLRPVLLFASVSLLAQQQAQQLPQYNLSASETAEVRTRLAALTSKLKQLDRGDRDLLADVAIAQKAAEWTLRHPEEVLTKAYHENTLKVLDWGMARAAELEKGSPSWPSKKGRLARAYWSRVDGSVQPYTILVPDDYAGAPMRLDVVMHGTNRRMSEVSFVADAEFGQPVVPAPGRLELHVFGRTNNAYRWAGETDVLEAVASVQKKYRVDPKQVVLRGFSMGGAGGWHLGLHRPDRWAAIEAGAGFTDTEKYAKRGGAPEHEKRVWSIYDSYLYARNMIHVPTVGYGSINDAQLQASVNIKEQLAKETTPKDLRALFIVGPAIGHKFAPESKAESEEFIRKAIAAGRPEPDHIQFLTYTTRYNRCFWLRVDGLERHFQRAEVDATRQGKRIQAKTINVTRLILPEGSQAEIDGQTISEPVSAVEKHDGKWRKAALEPKALGKRHGLQGPIDDAFLSSFLCVRPTGKAKDAAAHDAALRRLGEFTANWEKFFRGEVRLKDDKAVSDDDIRNHHLVLFGDAGSNSWIAKVLGRIPVPAKPGPGEVLVAIYPNPLNPKKYVVINSGHTFGEADLRGTNALLYPRLGDWAILDAQGVVKSVGFFDEHWKPSAR